MIIKKCQVFTPDEGVKLLLESIGYKKNLFGKKVLENTCGDGNILKIIVEVYIKDSIKNNIELEKIKVGLENDICGVEIDRVHYNKCISNLDKIALKYGLNDIRWNIINKNFFNVEFDSKFQYIIGNPPYINYRDLDIRTRKELRDRFISCKRGKFDYCYAFIEESIQLLDKGGKLSYLIPNSIFKNVFAEELRHLILPYLSKIYDYKNKRLFFNAITTSAIMVCKKGSNNNNLRYYDLVERKDIVINKEELNGKWVFDSGEVNVNTRRFGDYFLVGSSIATLANEVYVIKDYNEIKEGIQVNEFCIERELIKEAASPRALAYNKKEKILFPYKFNDVNNDLIRYSSEEFSVKFKEATKYLRSNSEKLYKRKSDKNTMWFEYGRTQAIAHMNQEKLIMSSVATKKIKVYKLNKDTIPYSGIYIVKKSELELDYAQKILKSDEFWNYVKKIGINASGDSIRITANDIKNFKF